jgi:AcrR family transcriptional regulator
MGKRGDELREVILWAAVDVFLEAGFERASMDAVALRAATSKRTLYAHFESKENLFLAVVELIRSLTLDRLGHPEDHGDDPAQALVGFCVRYLSLFRYEPAVQMCRISISEAARFPQGAARHFDAVFAEADLRLRAYLTETFGLPEGVVDEEVRSFLGGILYPGVLQALFGVDELVESFEEEAPLSDAELVRVGKAVEGLIDSVERLRAKA